jgi:hypothetical protein
MSRQPQAPALAPKAQLAWDSSHNARSLGEMRPMLTRILSALLLVTLPAVAPAAPFRWEGEWNRFGRQSGGSLEITKVTPNGFTFNLGASAGANNGEIEGTAKLQGDKATFSKKDPELGETCDVTFQPKQVPGYRDQASRRPRR